MVSLLSQMGSRTGIFEKKTKRIWMGWKGRWNARMSRGVGLLGRGSWTVMSARSRVMVDTLESARARGRGRGRYHMGEGEMRQGRILRLVAWAWEMVK